MKTMIFSFLALVVFVSAQAAFADADVALEAGIRSQSGTTDAAGVSTKSQTGFQLGGTAAFALNGPLFFRTGLLYTQRPLVASSAAADVKYTMNYVDIPLTLMYKFEDYAGVFGGAIVAINMDSNCDSGCSKVTGVKSTYIPLVIGATFKFAPQLGATLYFEAGSGEVADGLKDYKAVGANLAVTF